MLGLAQVFGKETVAGVDIGSRWIKVVQAEASGPGALAHQQGRPRPRRRRTPSGTGSWWRPPRSARPSAS